MNILAISTLFPTMENCHHGVFVKNRLAAMSKQDGVTINVCNPIPTSWLHRCFERYMAQQNSPFTEVWDNIHIIRPRYSALPGINKGGEHKRLLKNVLGQLCSQKHIDHVDVHWTYPDLALGLAIAKTKNVPCTITLRGMEAFYSDEKDERPKLIAEMLTQVDAIIALSQEMADKAQSLAPNIPVHVVRNGVDLNRFFYTPQTQARTELNLPLNASILLGVGALIQRKGFHHIIEALQTMPARNADSPLYYYIVGDAGMEGDFKKSLKGMLLDMPEKNIFVKFAGKVDNRKLQLWYSAADIFCLSSLGEGSPNVLTEALACGCLALATDVGSVSDILNSEENLGTLLPNPNQCSHKQTIEAWSEALQESLNTPCPATREDRANKMLTYSWEWCAQQALNAINNCHPTRA